MDEAVLDLALLDDLPIGLYRTSPEGHFLAANRPLLAMLGYKDLEDLRRVLADKIYLDSRDRQRWTRQLEQKGLVQNFEVRLRRKDGTPIWVVENCQVSKKADGTIRHYQGSLLEVTQRKQAEERFARFAESVTDVIYRFDRRQNRYEFISPSLERQTGYRVEELLADPGQMVMEATLPEDLPRVQQQAREHMARGPGAGPIKIQYRIRHKCGAIIWVSESLDFEYSQEGECQYVNSVVRDITDRIQAEQEADSMQAQLLQAQKMEAVGTLAGGVAHDFNNLLTAITGFIELADRQVQAGGDPRSDLEQARSAADQAARICRQLLLFGRRQPMKMVPLDLNHHLEELLLMLQRIIREDIRIETSLQEGLWPVTGDQASLEQVVLNLAVNARDAMPDGGVLRFRTRNRPMDRTEPSRPDHPSGRYVEIQVQDQGIGMDQETMDRLFEPFFTTKKVGEGTGLGLAVAYGTVGQHAGWIEVQSQPGQGSTFTIYLPASERTTDHPGDRIQATPGEVEGRSRRVLLVEDEEAVLRFARRALLLLGFQVDSAPNIAAAREIFRTRAGRFDLVFSDVILPDGNGIELAQELKAERPDLPVLLTSGYTDLGGHPSSSPESAHQLLRKPYSLQELATALQAALGDL